MTNDHTGSAVDRRLVGAEHLAAAAVRTLLASLPLMESRGILCVLDDVEHLFSQIDATESCVRLARAAEDPEEALEHAEDAYSLAHAALEEASQRVRRASQAGADASVSLALGCGVDHPQRHAGGALLGERREGPR
jgi:hypothetical protein